MFFRKRRNTKLVAGTNHIKNKDFFSMVVLSLVVGVFIFSWIDKDARDAFAELAKIGVTGYIALLVPKRCDRFHE